MERAVGLGKHPGRFGVTIPGGIAGGGTQGWGQGAQLALMGWEGFSSLSHAGVTPGSPKLRGAQLELRRNEE